MERPQVEKSALLGSLRSCFSLILLMEVLGEMLYLVKYF